MATTASSAPRAKTAPGLRQLVPGPFGPLARSRRDPLGFMVDASRRYGDVFRLRLGPLVFHQVTHPDGVKRVLLDNQRNYPRSWMYGRTRVVVGEGLVTTEGAPWRRLRRLAQPAFHHRRIAALAGVMTEAIGSMLSHWRDLAAAGEPVDVAAEFGRLTLNIVGRALLGIDLGGEADRIGAAVTESLGYLEYRVNTLIPVPYFIPTARNRRAHRAIATFDAVVADILASRRRAPGQDRGDLLSILLEVRDEETGTSLSDRELRDQIVTFIGAGHETTAVALAWTFYLLSLHPDADSRLRDEVDGALDGRVPTIDDLPNLDFTRRVIEESLRIYPPVYGTVRDAREEDEIGGFRIPARTMVVLAPYVTHRHPEFWPDPERFDPDRFLPEAAAARPRFAWYPFLAGPHQCIGQEFAMMEATLAVAMVAQAFRLRLAPGAVVEPRPMLTLRPRGGIPMILEAR
ncbi:MAG TPA: cytochrome P450 [Isosphaeraceae bacterium]